MVGSPVGAAFVAQIAFWVMLAVGVASGTLRNWKAALFLVLWAIGYLGLPRLSPFSGPYVTPYVASLDIVLAFIVLYGDTRLT